MLAMLLTALLAATGQPEAYRHERADELLHFGYGWPAIVEEEPALREMLAAEMAEAETHARATAGENRNQRRDNDFPFHRHEYSKVWTVAGSTPQLLSLTASNETYTGGAHGNLTLHSLLWDRAADREVDPRTVVGGRAGLDRLAPRYCEALNAERSIRRGEAVTPDPSDSFTACPAIGEQVLAFEDSDGNGRFDTLSVLLPPYAAGPWVEGPYPIDIPLEPEDLEGIDAGWRPAFEAGDPISRRDAEASG